jgi:hypothetical protein
MLKSFLTVLAIFITATGLFAEDVDDTKNNSCEGAWILQSGPKWTATRASDGLKLYIHHNATIFDCGGNQCLLQEGLSGSKVAVSCEKSSEQEGAIYVQKIWITCE